MDKYLSDFLVRNKKKSFYKNLQKYINLKHNERLKCVLSFLTHIVIDAENNIQNDDIQKELLIIVNDFIMCKQDYFFDWLMKKLNEEGISPFCNNRQFARNQMNKRTKL